MSDEDNKKYLAMLYDIRCYAGKQFDHLIVVYSTGAFLFTLVVLTKPCDLLLLLSLISFVFSLLCIPVSDQMTIFSIDFEIKGNSKKSYFYGKIIRCLNWSAFALLCLGTAFLITYGILNLSH